MDFILLMHDDADEVIADSAWPAYFAMLRDADAFDGGSSIGAGEVWRKRGTAGAASDHLTGFIRLRAPNMAAARQLAEHNPVFVGGGTIEIRELPRD